MTALQLHSDTSKCRHALPPRPGANVPFCPRGLTFAKTSAEVVKIALSLTRSDVGVHQFLTEIAAPISRLVSKCKWNPVLVFPYDQPLCGHHHVE